MICRNCHRAVRKSYYARHRNICSFDPKSFEHFQESSSGSQRTKKKQR